MSIFTIRVELHGANYNDYQTLHAAMQQAGFSRTIKGDNGRVYHLPEAEYTISTVANAESVRTLASGAAQRTGKQFAVLVTTAGEIAWVGLPQLA
jgi:Endoribonuclease GhoS